MTGVVSSKVYFDVVQGEFTRFYLSLYKNIPSDSATPFLCGSSECLLYIPETLISVKGC